MLRRAEERDVPSIRLLQTAYRNRSLALYAKLGFEIRSGPPLPETSPRATPCAGAFTAITDRHGEVADAIGQSTTLAVEHDDRISGYSTGLAFFAHSVGETNEDLKALIGAASEFAGPGILVPAANIELFGWCLGRGMRVVQLMTLMTVGLYNEPAGSYLPSVRVTWIP